MSNQQPIKVDNLYFFEDDKNEDSKSKFDYDHREEN